MSDYLLFVDTETSGWPKDWRQPYSAEGNWPYVVQVAWVIYTRDGKEVKAENYFISNDDFLISPASHQIHGISREYRLTHGKPRETVLQIFAQDVQYYQPLIIGYFTQLDYHLLSAEFYRLGRDNPLRDLSVFCVMKAAGAYSYFPTRRYLSLDKLYRKLFQTPLREHHQADADVRATAQCFFELRRQGRITDQMIARQQPLATVGQTGKDRTAMKLILVLLILLLLATFLYWFLS